MQALIEDAVALRHLLADRPEPSGNEAATSAAVAAWLEERGLEVETHVGGHGLLVRTTASGPGMLWRAELDAVHARDGLGHHCGHDGHMAMLCGALARMQEEGRPVAALFQPAEETGEGMLRALQDERVASLRPTAAYAIHNVPSQELGAVIIGPGAMASTGLRLTFRGTSSHAAEPQEGQSPWPLMRQAADAIRAAQDGDPRATLVHVRLGSESYGTSPGLGVVAATVRGSSDAEVEGLVERLAPESDEGIDVQAERVEPFPATRNDPSALREAQEAAHDAGLPVVQQHEPWPWSEDFGHALRRWPGALVGLGSGVRQPRLHDSAYTFPDALLQHGIRFWCALGARA